MRPFDFSATLYYKWSIVTMRLSCTVAEIWRLKYWTHGRGHKKKDRNGEKERVRGGKEKEKGNKKKRERTKGKGIKHTSYTVLSQHEATLRYRQRC